MQGHQNKAEMFKVEAQTDFTEIIKYFLWSFWSRLEAKLMVSCAWDFCAKLGLLK